MDVVLFSRKYTVYLQIIILNPAAVLEFCELKNTDNKHYKFICRQLTSR